jgi:hypothetical protein
MMDETLETTSAPRPWRQRAIGKPLGKVALPATDGVAPEPANMRNKPDRAPRQRKIGYLSSITTVNTAADAAATWTSARRGRAPHLNCGPAFARRGADNREPGRHHR